MKYITIKRPDYRDPKEMEQDLSCLYRMLGMKVNRNKTGLLVMTETHSYQLEVRNAQRI
tara:strand:+ start:243 stop:419 length:177 start_codon:yes stop_codon:yes gene_type:complete